MQVAGYRRGRVYDLDIWSGYLPDDIGKERVVGAAKDDLVGTGIQKRLKAFLDGRFRFM